MSSTPQRSGQLIPDRLAVIHREMLQLVALAVIAVAAFFLTRAVAINNRESSLRTAAEWYRRGEQELESGRIDDAIAAFRRANVKSRNNKVYSVALARSLTIKGDRDSARAILLTLRESAPEDASINLQLARIARDRQDVTEALRFYHDALYAPWPPDATEAWRGVRLELIQFLLTHGQASDAQSELLAASADSPDDVTHHLELAQLFGAAGDHARTSRKLEGYRTLVHEWGHMAAAKLCGVAVPDFAIGMGPSLWHFTWRGTRLRSDI